MVLWQFQGRPHCFRYFLGLTLTDFVYLLSIAIIFINNFFCFYAVALRLNEQKKMSYRMIKRQQHFSKNTFIPNKFNYKIFLAKLSTCYSIFLDFIKLLSLVGSSTLQT